MNKLTNGLLGLVILCSTSVHAQDAGNAPAQYELKGVSLGIDVQTFQSKFPAAECKPEKIDAGLLVCTDNTITFSDQPARFRGHFLDGTLVRVAIEKITPDATLAASGPLHEKYGQPKVAKKQRNYHYTKTGRAIRMYDMWSWQNGHIELRTQPADDSIVDQDFTWGAIILVDHYRFDKMWFPRSKGEPAAAMPTIEGARNDI